MITRSITRSMVFGAFTLALGCGSPSGSDDRRADSAGEQLQFEHVASIVQEFSDDYMAVVQEVVDDSDCYGPRNVRSCLVDVRIIEYLAGSPGRSVVRTEGWEYKTLEAQMETSWPNRDIGRRRLVISARTKSNPSVYGSKLFILDPTLAEIAKLRDLVEEVSAGGKELAGAV